MKPGEIWMDEDKAHWKMLDARRAVGTEFEWFLSPVSRKRVETRENGIWSGYVIEWNADPVRTMMFKRASEMLGWKRVA